MSTEETDSELMVYIKRRRDINRRSAAKTRAKLKERTMYIKQMYYEAKSVNTQLIYRYRQLEQIKETLKAAWTAHKQLHQAAGHDVSEDASSLSRQSDIFRSAVCHPAASATLPLPFCQSLFQSQTDDAVTRCPSAVTISQCSVDDCFRYPACDNPPSIARVARHGFTSAACEQNSNVTIGDRQLTFPGERLSVLDCLDDVYGHKQASAVFDGDQPSSANDRWSTLRANSDDDGSLESLFGTDDWWSSDESWQWQCGT